MSTLERPQFDVHRILGRVNKHMCPCPGRPVGPYDTPQEP